MTYWLDANGRILCERHAGYYLATAIQADPKATWHWTPLGDWARWDIATTGLCESC